MKVLAASSRFVMSGKEALIRNFSTLVFWYFAKLPLATPSENALNNFAVFDRRDGQTSPSECGIF
jgi:hypothetical protein